MSGRARTFLLVLLVAACRRGDGVVLVSVTAQDGAPVAGIATLHATATLAGKTRAFDVPLGGRTLDLPPPKTFGLAIPSSLSGTLAVHIDARAADGTLVGSGDGNAPVAGGASARLTVTLTPTAPVVVDDMSMPVLAPRLIAPLSTAMVTAKRPTLRWIMPGSGTPVVDLCRDRACSLPLAIPVTIASDGRSAAPTMDLPTGAVFWRVRAQGGGLDLPSYTWEFFVPARAAAGGVDSSFGTVLDTDGDGFADLAVASTKFVRLFLGSSAGIPMIGSPSEEDIAAPEAGFGSGLASAGDVNGDGYADLIVGSSAGKVRIYLGSSNGVHPALASAVQLIDNPDGAGNANNYGWPVASAGDVNGDGYADVLISATTTPIGGTMGVGRVHLFFGSANGVQPAVAGQMQNLDGIDIAQSEFGDGIGSGDVNADGFSDVIVGAPFGGSNQQGRVRIFLGTPLGVQPSAVGKTVDIVGPDGSLSLFGIVASAADVNGDGYADFIVGASSTTVGGVSGVGRLHVYLGSAAGITPAVPSSIITIDGTDGLNGSFGGAISGGGDIDGDGFQDMITSGGTKAYVYYGAAGGFRASPTVIMNPDGANSGFGGVVAGIGDVNGDTYADIAVAAISVNNASGNAAGRVHGYYSGTAGLMPTTAGHFVTIDGPDGLNSIFGQQIAH